MSDVIIGGTYSVSNLLMGRPKVKVISSIINGGLYIPETSFVLRYKRGMFDGSNPTFKTDNPVWIYDDDGDLIFSGYISSIANTVGQTTIGCVSSVNKILTANIDYTSNFEHPAFILSSLAVSLGLSIQNTNIYASYYPEIVSVYSSTSNDNATGASALSSLIEMLSADIAIENDTLVCIPYQASLTSPYTLKHYGYPQLVDDGRQRYTQGVSINYVFSGGNPYSVGSTTDNMWNVDYGASSNLQAYGVESAQEIALARFNRFGIPRPLYMVSINKKYIYKPVLGTCYNLNGSVMNGLFRLIGYETDGKTYWLYLEAANGN